MEAPTPASALIHSSTLVIMGIYIIIRFSILFEFNMLVNYILSIIGALTIAFGAVVASCQNDIKKLVAYSTISQMGYLICGCGFCAYEEVVVYLIMHAVNKAFLFILVGYTVHFFNGNTDLRQMSNSYFYSLDLVIFFLTISFNLIGLPYSAGFLSKEFFLFQVLRDGFLTYLIRSMWFVSFFFTPLYMMVLVNSVSYGLKKSLIIMYKIIFNKQNFNVYNFLLKLKGNNLLINYQNNLFTSKLTSIILIIFWIIFYFLGEFILLILFNILSPIESIQSMFFFNIKEFTILEDVINNNKLFNLIGSIVFFFTLLSMLLLNYMLNINNNKLFYYYFDLLLIIYMFL
jgi:NADH:ubiquinone oxidoreductase subunit 5 (subunit L)/multisubunit Na+/H+ antiporter MnhA subunit